jgi:hypothetical protein
VADISKTFPMKKDASAVIDKLLDVGASFSAEKNEAGWKLSVKSENVKLLKISKLDQCSSGVLGLIRRVSS